MVRILENHPGSAKLIVSRKICHAPVGEDGLFGFAGGAQGGDDAELDFGVAGVGGGGFVEGDGVGGEEHGGEIAAEVGGEGVLGVGAELEIGGEFGGEGVEVFVDGGVEEALVGRDEAFAGGDDGVGQQHPEEQEGGEDGSGEAAFGLAAEGEEGEDNGGDGEGDPEGPVGFKEEGVEPGGQKGGCPDQAEKGESLRGRLADNTHVIGSKGQCESMNHVIDSNRVSGSGMRENPMPDARHPSPDGPYVRNLAALWQWDARLAMAIEAVLPERVPVLEAARDGSKTVRMGGVYLHSRYRPVEEAAKWAEGVKCEDKYVVVVSGFGLGYHVRALWERMPDEGQVIVAEPDVGLLRAAMEACDLSEIIGTGRLAIFTTLDRGALVERLEPKAPLMTSGMVFAAHGASLQAAAASAASEHGPANCAGPCHPATADFHSAFQKQITEFVAFTRTGFMTLMLNNVTTCRNIANNVGRYVTTPPIDLMQGAFAGCAAVLVAAGPSLAKNMHLLHEVKGKAVIIAVQTMLKPLLAAGIEPDFVTSLDYNTVSTRFFENLEEAGSTGKVHLVAEPKANWNVLDVFEGTMSCTSNDFMGRLLRGAAGGERMGLKAGATVAHLSFYLAEFLGCEPLILIGQDLGFVDGLYYKPGTAIHETWGPELGRFCTLETKEWERIARSRTILRKIPDIHGHPMYTEEQFFVYLQQFERDFAASRCTVIDATEGGAAKQHVKRMTFREAIDKHCRGSVEGISRPWKGWSCDRSGRMREAMAALKAREAEAADMKRTCEETVPLLEEMLRCQGDEAAMRELFVKVDRLRTRVGGNPETFEMVCHLNTIGELRRFQHDLRVKTVKDDEVERQKRQLERDMDYVKNLRVGAERLLEILAEAMGRLGRQLEAVEGGERWPVVVAGGRVK